MTAVGPAVGWLVVGLATGWAARRLADRDRDRMAARAPAAAGPLAWDGAGIEAVTAPVLVALAARLGWGWPAAPYAVLVATLAAVTVTDLRHYRVPDRIVAAGVAATGVAMGLATVATGRPERLGGAALGAVAFAAPLLAVHLVLPRGMGWGDVKLSVLLGAGIGWIGPAGVGVVLAVVWALIVACALGLGVALALRRRLAAGSSWGVAGSIPFAPALSAATVAVVLVAGPRLR